MHRLRCPKISPNSLGKDTGISTAQNIGEAEANRRLAIFENTHRWDLNIDDDQLEEMDDAIHVRDLNAQGMCCMMMEVEMQFYLLL